MGTSRDHHLQGKVAIVTGANRGIGKETALQLSKAGAKVSAVKSRAEQSSLTPKICIYIFTILQRVLLLLLVQKMACGV